MLPKWWSLQRDVAMYEPYTQYTRTAEVCVCVCVCESEIPAVVARSVGVLRSGGRPPSLAGALRVVPWGTCPAWHRWVSGPAHRPRWDQHLPTQTNETKIKHDERYHLNPQIRLIFIFFEKCFKKNAFILGLQGSQPPCKRPLNLVLISGGQVVSHQRLTSR